MYHPKQQKKHEDKERGERESFTTKLVFSDDLNTNSAISYKLLLSIRTIN